MGSDTPDADAPPAHGTQAANPFANQMVADFLALAVGAQSGAHPGSMAALLGIPSTLLSDGPDGSLAAVQPLWQVQTGWAQLAQAGVFGPDTDPALAYAMMDQTIQPQQEAVATLVTLQADTGVPSAHTQAMQALAAAQTAHIQVQIQGNTALGTVMDATTNPSNASNHGLAVDFSATQHFNLLTLDVAALGGQLAQDFMAAAHAASAASASGHPRTDDLNHINPLAGLGQYLHQSIEWDTDGDGKLDDNCFARIKAGKTPQDNSAPSNDTAWAIFG